jgi:integrase/recombinase XerD
MKDSTAFPSLVQYFFAQHLCAHKHVSPRTVTSYRDTFRLLLEFLQSRTGRPASSLQITDLDAQTILDFLDHLEINRGNTIPSRNLRLCAIRSFFHIVAVRDPANMALANRVLAIPTKRTTRRLLTYLNRDETDAILAAPDQNTWLGSRDHALLLTLYNSGARASEITNLSCGQVTFGSHTVIHLHGKGRKDRTVPLWPQTSRVLQVWFQKMESTPESIAFPTIHGGRLSADGLDHLLQKAVEKATTTCPSLEQKRITPHVVRRTTAMHLLQGGVDITVIALWLGHESIETTHGYIEADLAMKELALAKLTPAQGRSSRFKPKDELLRFLTAL